MEQKMQYKQPSFKIVNLNSTDIICESSTTIETIDGQIEDSIW